MKINCILSQNLNFLAILNPPYETLIYLNSFGKDIKEKNFNICSKYLDKNNIISEIKSRASDNKLLELSKKFSENIDPILCIRCRLSDPIKKNIDYLYKRHKEFHEIDYPTMLSYVLNDRGEKFIKTSTVNDKKFKKPFNWQSLSIITSNNLYPFSAKIIKTFNKKLSSLDTWTTHQIKSESSLKEYLVKCDLRLQSDWSLIADTSTKRILEACKEFNTLKINNNDIISLHKSYLINYKKAKAAYKKKYGRISGWVPNQAFINSLNPKQSTLVNLECIAAAIRKYEKGLKSPESIPSIKQYLLEKKYEGSSDEDQIKEERQINLIKKLSKELAKDTLEILFKKERIIWLKDKDRKLAWELYSKGYSQRDIAKRCNHKQGWVSKLLKEKILAEKISLKTALKLKDLKEFEGMKTSPSEIDKVINSLIEYITKRQLNKNTSILQDTVNYLIKK